MLVVLVQDGRRFWSIGTRTLSVTVDRGQLAVSGVSHLQPLHPRQPILHMQPLLSIPLESLAQLLHILHHRLHIRVVARVNGDLILPAEKRRIRAPDAILSSHCHNLRMRNALKSPLALRGRRLRRRTHLRSSPGSRSSASRCLTLLPWGCIPRSVSRSS